jgi:hypothetical protein
MLWSKYKHAYLAFGTAFVFSMTIWFLGVNGYFSETVDVEIPEPEITIVNQFSEEDFLIKPGTYVYEETKYLLCGNVEVKLVDSGRIVGQTIAQTLQNAYMSNKGWRADILKNDTVVFHREINDFCPRHVNKRHLSVKDGYVVIMYGPSDTNGGIAQFTNILAGILPENIRRQLETGLLEFNSHEEALQALDNFDEYY